MLTYNLSFFLHALLFNTCFLFLKARSMVLKLVVRKKESRSLISRIVPFLCASVASNSSQLYMHMLDGSVQLIRIGGIHKKG